MNMKYRSNIKDYSLQMWSKNNLFLCIDYLEGILNPYIILRQKPKSITRSIKMI